jgi:hypothetical protein
MPKTHKMRDELALRMRMIDVHRIGGRVRSRSVVRRLGVGFGRSVRRGVAGGPAWGFRWLLGVGVIVVVWCAGSVGVAAAAAPSPGTVYIADSGNNQVVEVPAGGGPQTTVGTGLSDPDGVAVDGAGDVFIADTVNERVVEVPAGGGPQTTVATGLTYPSGVAVYAPAPTFTADRPGGAATVATPYSYTFAASSAVGEPAASFHVQSGTLPPGVSLDAVSGVLSGTPTAAGSYTFTIEAENAAHGTFASPATITVASVTPPPTPTPPAPTPTPSPTPTPTPSPSSGCPAASGALTGEQLGPLTLNMTRTAAQGKLPAYTAANHHTDRFCLQSGAILAGYSTPQALAPLTAAQRQRLNRRVVILLTANPYYALDGLRPGAPLTTARHTLKLGSGEKIGDSTWYVIAEHHRSGILKVTHGTIQQIGIANPTLTHTPTSQHTLLHNL